MSDSAASHANGQVDEGVAARVMPDAGADGHPRCAAVTTPGDSRDQEPMVERILIWFLTDVTPFTPFATSTA